MPQILKQLRASSRVLLVVALLATFIAAVLMSAGHVHLHGSHDHCVNCQMAFQLLCILVVCAGLLIAQIQSPPQPEEVTLYRRSSYRSNLWVRPPPR